MEVWGVGLKTLSVGRERLLAVLLGKDIGLGRTFYSPTLTGCCPNQNSFEQFIETFRDLGNSLLRMGCFLESTCKLLFLLS